MNLDSFSFNPAMVGEISGDNSEQPVSAADHTWVRDKTLTSTSEGWYNMDKTEDSLDHNLTGKSTQYESQTLRQAVVQHPLLPLVQELLEQCELLTRFPEHREDIQVEEVFNKYTDIKNHELLSGEFELDQLIVEVVWVLRVHLLELSKVGELCDDFCDRYITCLRSKLFTESLLSPSELDESLDSDSGSLTQKGDDGDGMSLGENQVLSGGTVYQMVHTPQGLVARAIQIQTTDATQVVSGSNPTANNSVPLPDEDCSKNAKRGVLPKSATQVLKSWLFQHIVHPYPTEDQKRELSCETGLTILQINNWFINARRRILQPMLESSNVETTKQPKKCSKSQTLSRPQKQWPKTLASLRTRSKESENEKTDAATKEPSNTPLLITSSGQVIQGNYSDLLPTSSGSPDLPLMPQGFHVGQVALGSNLVQVDVGQGTSAS